MTAIHCDIEMWTGRTFTQSVACAEVDPTTGKAVTRDLTGWTGAMQIRPSAGDTATVYATATVTIDVDSGVVTATVADEDTVAATWRSGTYDLVITDGIEVDTLTEGTARLRRSTTVL